MLADCLVSGIIAYLLGSIPFGLVLVRVFRGIDVRTTGSGNIGTANVARVAPGLGLATLFFDSAKGLAAVLIGRAIALHRLSGASDLRYVAIITGLSALMAVVGHVFSVWLKFKGGKGVATAMGAFLGLMPLAVLICLVFYVAIYAIWHYTSLASILSAALFPCRGRHDAARSAARAAAISDCDFPADHREASRKHRAVGGGNGKSSST